MSRLTACLGYIVSRDDVVKDGVGVQGAEKQDCAEQDVEQKCRVELRVESSGCSSTQAENNKQQHAKVSAHPLFSAAQNSAKNRNTSFSRLSRRFASVWTRARSGDARSKSNSALKPFQSLKVTRWPWNTLAPTLHPLSPFHTLSLPVALLLDLDLNLDPDHWLRPQESLHYCQAPRPATSVPTATSHCAVNRLRRSLPSNRLRPPSLPPILPLSRCLPKSSHRYAGKASVPSYSRSSTLSLSSRPPWRCGKASPC